MAASIRHRLSAIAGLATLAFGIGFVGIFRSFLTLFSVSSGAFTPTHQPIPPLRPVQTFTASNDVSELSCYDLNILPVWQELKKDDDFRDLIAMAPGRYDCSELLEIKREDLNGDRHDEFFVTGKDLQFCGATGNCHLWVFGIRNGRVVQLLHSGGITIERQKSKRNGLQNLVVRFNGSSYPDSLFEYRFDGSRFRLARCYRQDKQSLEKWEEDCEGPE